MDAQIPGMDKAGRVYAGIYRRYGKYPVYTGICGVRRSLYGLPAPRRATARRAGPNAARRGAFPMIRKGGASRASALRRVAPSGANSSTRARARGAQRGATRRGRAPAAVVGRYARGGVLVVEVELRVPVGGAQQRQLGRPSLGPKCSRGDRRRAHIAWSRQILARVFSVCLITQAVQK